jgi:alkylhydroperoxidase/carboxymuconolactone decarboxylase family protein YurZ
MAKNPWRSGVLPRKTVELVALAVCVACTNLNADGTRRHMRAALDAGASRAEILMVAKMGALMALHSLSLGAPILLEEAKAAGVEKASKRNPPATPACDRIRALGQWNDAWNPFMELDPEWTDAFMAAGANVYAAGVFEPKLVELLSIAFDASFTHMYAPGTRRHIRSALKLGASLEEVVEVLKICVAQGLQSINLAVPILAELTAQQENSRA